MGREEDWKQTCSFGRQRVEQRAGVTRWQISGKKERHFRNQECPATQLIAKGGSEHLSLGGFKQKLDEHPVCWATQESISRALSTSEIQGLGAHTIEVN